MAATKSPAQIGYELIQKDTAELLRPLGFKRKGPIIFTRTADNFGVLHFQSSSKSSKAEIIFTLNIGVIIGKLVDSRCYSQFIKHPSSMYAQIRVRIGFFLPEKQDVWWNVSRVVDAPRWCKDFSQLILEEAVPFVQHNMKIDNVVSAWEQGRSPGLTDGERVVYLARLHKLVERRSSPD
jgi:Domain of unknown function (DUF4304)